MIDRTFMQAKPPASKRLKAIQRSLKKSHVKNGLHFLVGLDKSGVNEKIWPKP